MAEIRLPYTAEEIMAILDGSNTDGEWHIFRKRLVPENTNSDEGTIDIDLSEYIPNDNHYYQVTFWTQVNTANGYGAVYLASSVETNVSGASTKGSSVNNDTVDVIIGLDRVLKVSHASGTNGSYNLTITKYKRLAKAPIMD